MQRATRRGVALSVNMSSHITLVGGDHAPAAFRSAHESAAAAFTRAHGGVVVATMYNDPGEGVEQISMPITASTVADPQLFLGISSYSLKRTSDFQPLPNEQIRTLVDTIVDVLNNEEPSQDPWSPGFSSVPDAFVRIGTRRENKQTSVVMLICSRDDLMARDALNAARTMSVDKFVDSIEYRRAMQMAGVSRDVLAYHIAERLKLLSGLTDKIVDTQSIVGASPVVASNAKHALRADRSWVTHSMRKYRGGIDMARNMIHIGNGNESMVLLRGPSSGFYIDSVKGGGYRTVGDSNLHSFIPVHTQSTSNVSLGARAAAARPVMHRANGVEAGIGWVGSLSYHPSIVDDRGEPSADMDALLGYGDARSDSTKWERNHYEALATVVSAPDIGSFTLANLMSHAKETNSDVVHMSMYNKPYHDMLMNLQNVTQQEPADVFTPVDKSTVSVKRDLVEQVVAHMNSGTH